MAFDNRVATVKDLIKFLQKNFKPETNLVYDTTYYEDREPVLLTDFQNSEAWKTYERYERRYMGKEFESTAPAVLI